VLVLAATAALAIHFVQLQEWRVDGLSAADWPTFFGVAAALLGVMLINGVILRDLVASYGATLKARSWIGLALVGPLVNLISPVRGGFALRAVYLRRVHDIPLSEIGTVLLGSTLCSMTVSAGLAAAAITALGVPGGAYGWTALGLTCLMILGLLTALWVPLPQAVVNRFPPRIANLANAWRTLGRQHTLILRVFAWNVLAAALHAVAFVLAFSITSFAAGWLVPVTSSAFARIATLIAITPAGLGVFETFGVVSATIVGAEAGAALLAVLVVRLAGVLVTLGGGALMLPTFIRESTASPERATPPQRRIEP